MGSGGQVYRDSSGLGPHREAAVQSLPLEMCPIHLGSGTGVGSPLPHPTEVTEALCPHACWKPVTLHPGDQSHQAACSRWAILSNWRRGSQPPTSSQVQVHLGHYLMSGFRWQPDRFWA